MLLGADGRERNPDGATVYVVGPVAERIVIVAGNAAGGGKPGRAAAQIVGQRAGSSQRWSSPFVVLTASTRPSGRIASDPIGSPIESRAGAAAEAVPTR